MKDPPVLQSPEAACPCSSMLEAPVCAQTIHVRQCTGRTEGRRTFLGDPPFSDVRLETDLNRRL